MPRSTIRRLPASYLGARDFLCELCRLGLPARRLGIGLGLPARLLIGLACGGAARRLTLGGRGTGSGFQFLPQTLERLSELLLPRGLGPCQLLVFFRLRRGLAVHGLVAESLSFLIVGIGDEKLVEKVERAVVVAFLRIVLGGGEHILPRPGRLSRP